MVLIKIRSNYFFFLIFEFSTMAGIEFYAVISCYSISYTVRFS
jgi:hypothetical protein